MMKKNDFMICGEVKPGEKVHTELPYHLSYDGKDLVAMPYYAGAPVRNICFNTGRMYMLMLAENHADLNVAEERGNAVRFTLADRQASRPQLTAWNA